MVPTEFLEAGWKPDYVDEGQIPVDRVLTLLYLNEFDKLDSLAAAGQLDSIGDKWGEIALRLMIYGDYNPYGEHGEKGTQYMDRAVPWVDKMKPGIFGQAVDMYGNNVAVYVYAAMCESLWGSQECWAYDEAAIVVKFLRHFGCDDKVENRFGVSAAMLLGLVGDVNNGGEDDKE